MKNWLKMILLSLLLVAVVPVGVSAAGTASASLTAEGQNVSVVLHLPEGKTETITSLRLQLRVSTQSGSMNAPSFGFDNAVVSEVKDAVVTKEESGSYLVDIIASGKKAQNMFGGKESLNLGKLSLQPASGEYEIKVEIVGEMDGSEVPVVKYMDAGGISEMTVGLSGVQPLLVQAKNTQPPKTDPVVDEALSKKIKLSATVGKGSRTVVFTWTKISGVDGYALYEKDKLVKYISPATVTAYSKKYSYASKHTFKICAYKIASDGSKKYGKFSSSVDVTVGPGKPASFAAKYKNTSKVTLSWKKVSGAKGYQIYRSTKKNSGYKLVKTIKKGSATSYTLSHKDGKIYYYKVRAYVNGAKNKRITGDYSKALPAMTKAPKVSVSKKSASKQIVLRWNKISRADGYKVYRSKKKSSGFKLVKTINKQSETSFTEKMPKGSSVWYYKVCAFEKPKKGKSVTGYSAVVKAK